MTAGFKVGDKVRPKADSLWGENNTAGIGQCSTWGGVLEITADYGTSVGARNKDGLVGNFSYNQLELAEPEIGVGDTVTLTRIIKGVVTKVSYDFVTVDTAGGAYVPLANYSVEVVKKAAPVYTPGKLYRDAKGALVHRRSDAGLWGWTLLRSDGCVEALAEGEPVRPLTEVAI